MRGECFMAEFCYKCFKEILDADGEEKDVLISKELDLCEGCGETKPVVVRYKNFYLFKEAIRGLFKF